MPGQDAAVGLLQVQFTLCGEGKQEELSWHCALLWRHPCLCLPADGSLGTWMVLSICLCRTPWVPLILRLILSGVFFFPFHHLCTIPSALFLISILCTRLFMKPDSSDLDHLRSETRHQVRLNGGGTPHPAHPRGAAPEEKTKLSPQTCSL